MEPIPIIITLIFLLLSIVICPSYCGLTVASNKPCGQVSCKELQFCSPFGNICKECSEVCNPQSHNHDEDTCHKQCQDYLHNLHFVKRNESTLDAARLAALTREVRQVQVVAWLALGCSLLCAGLLFAVCLCRVARARRRHGGIRAILRNAFQAFKGRQREKEKCAAAYRGEGAPPLKLEIPVVPPPPVLQQSPPPPHTASTTLPDTPPPPPRLAYSKQRSPSEDATLDYAYDNPALTPSPTLVKAVENGVCKRETNF